MKRSKMAIATIVPAVLALVSCQQFFTTSLAESLARDPADILPEVTVDNASDLAEATDGDSEASLALLEDLTDLFPDSTAEEKIDLAAISLDVASSASGVEAALMEKGDDLQNLLVNNDVDDPDVKEQYYQLVEEALAGLGNLDESAAALLSMFSDPDVSVADVAAASSAENLAMAAVMLLASEAVNEPAGVATYIGDFSPTGTLTETEQLAVDLATAAVAQGATGALADLLKAINLNS